ncbi:hypothetical protein ACX80W_04375 [Arthrobacter sp. TMN-37]
MTNEVVAAALAVVGVMIANIINIDDATATHRSRNLMPGRFC